MVTFSGTTHNTQVKYVHDCRLVTLICTTILTKNGLCVEKKNVILITFPKETTTTIFSFSSSLVFFLPLPSPPLPIFFPFCHWKGETEGKGEKENQNNKQHIFNIGDLLKEQILGKIFFYMKISILEKRSLKNENNNCLKYFTSCIEHASPARAGWFFFGWTVYLQFQSSWKLLVNLIWIHWIVLAEKKKGVPNLPGTRVILMPSVAKWLFTVIRSGNS